MSRSAESGSTASRSAESGSTASRSAVVCGGGVGGLAAAVALHRSGWHVQVLERRSSPAGGTALTLSPNALAALDALDLGRAVRAGAAALGPMSLRRADGRWLAHLPAPPGAPGPLHCVRRSHLGGALAAALPATALRWGTTVLHVDPGTAARPARVVSSAGELTADLVVAADGIASPLRALVAPDCRPRPAGYDAWRAVVEEAPRPVRGATETWGRGERVGLVALPGRAAYVYATAPAAPRPPAGGAPAGDAAGDLAARFAGWHEPIPAVLAALAGVAVHHDAVAALPAPPRALHTGRLVLLGDAAHAMEPNLGQGACLALEDAVELAHALGARAVPGALPAYAAARRPRVAALLARSRRLGRLGLVHDPLAVALRDAALRLTPRGTLVRQAERVWAWRPPGASPGRGLRR